MVCSVIYPTNNFNETNFSLLVSLTGLAATLRRILPFYGHGQRKIDYTDYLPAVEQSMMESDMVVPTVEVTPANNLHLIKKYEKFRQVQTPLVDAIAKELHELPKVPSRRKSCNV